MCSSFLLFILCTFHCSWEVLNLPKLWLWCLNHLPWTMICLLQHSRQVFNLKIWENKTRADTIKWQALTALSSFMFFQIKRPQAKAYFANAISNMYAELSTSDPSPQSKLWTMLTKCCINAEHFKPGIHATSHLIIRLLGWQHSKWLGTSSCGRYLIFYSRF